MPSPRVDDILHVLLALRLVDGISAHEHYGFKPALTTGIFPAPTFRLLKRQRSAGLNNLVFCVRRLRRLPSALAPAA